MFYVFNGSAATLISRKTSEELGVLRLGPLVGSVGGSCLSYPAGLGVGLWRERYSECFSGVGCLRDYQVSLHIDPNVRATAQPVRRMPFGHRKLAKGKLDELLASGIIERVEGPTQWVSPIVTVPKDNNDIRLCVDMCVANKAII